jgi:hypothetical protein
MLNEVVKPYLDDVTCNIMIFLVSAGWGTSTFCLDESSGAKCHPRKMDWLWWNSPLHHDTCPLLDFSCGAIWNLLCMPTLCEQLSHWKNVLKRKVKKGKVIPVTGHGGPQVCETSRIPHFLDSRLTDGAKVVSLTRRLPLTPPGRFLVLISVRGWVSPRPWCGWKD